MKKKINKNLMGIAVLAILLTCMLTTLLFARIMQRQVNDQLKDYALLLSSSDEILELIEENYEPDESDMRITLISPEGEVLYESSSSDEAAMENHLSRQEIKEALTEGEGTSFRRSDTIGKFTFYYAMLLSGGNILRVSRDMYYFSGLLKVLIPELIIEIAAIFVLCMVLGNMLTRRFVKPIEALAANSENIGSSQTYPEIQPFVETITGQHRELKRSAKMRQEFTANVSHELKTPLTSISGYAELIKSGIASGDDALRFAEEIHKNAGRLLTLINDILRLSQLDSVEEYVTMETVDLFEIADSTKDMLAINAEASGISVKVRGGSTLLSANRQMMEELIYNLCDNGIRYNNPGGEVLVSVGYEDKRPFVCVKDTGIGIPEKDLERIFERFYRVDKSRSKQTGGTGLGLAIVKHIVVLHDAEIKVESALGKGTMIKVLFPSGASES